MQSRDKSLTLPNYLFWDLDVTQIDADCSYRLIIERVIQLGTMPQWRSTQQYYGKDRFLEIANSSKQLSERERNFTRLFIESDYHVALPPEGDSAGNERFALQA